MITVKKLDQAIISFVVTITRVAKDLNGNDVEVVDREYQISPDVQRSLVVSRQAELTREQDILAQIEAVLTPTPPTT